MNTAIIVAAGSGTRFGSKTPKQFLELLGKPLIIHTLFAFENCPQIDAVVLVLSSTETANFLKIVSKYNLKKLVKIVSGGTSRAESVLKGFNAIRPTNAEIVAVHDGARPCVTSAEISQTIEKARATGAACLVASVTDTIKEVADGKIIGTINRNKLRRALTPQAFRYDVLKRALFENEIGEIATDECYLVEKLGIEVSIVEGNSTNIKVTTQEDLVIAEQILKKIKT
jgi:2-C-methyl-D-erythritol 4-phosphate cytidylyltransferase